MSDPRTAGAATDPVDNQHSAPDVDPVTPATYDAAEHRPRSLAGDAVRDLVRNPLFAVSAVLIAILVVMAAFPQLFTDQRPGTAGFCNLANSRQGPSSQAWFGYDLQGCDVYTLTIYGARASILVGILGTGFALLLGLLAGVASGFYGGWVDTLISRITDIFFGIPSLLGALLVLVSFPPGDSALSSILTVTVALGILGWTSMARIMRATVIQVKQADYVQAARALGARGGRIILRHVLPNGLAPVLVYATIALGVFIAAEASLSFLGVGLQPPTVSWGIALSDARNFIRQSPHMLLFPGAFLSVTVLAFIMLGEAVRDAFDPKLR
ncbi:ABC transporter permease [Vallicoccus soli]|uniref:ABC transporter permease n=1 Tax=Vallicoccus soli TaxID=2339232 RepID=A0A3A3Z171_9ACTN|nr:ABC transporter permease [Vallicoccus soli]RJK98000.1 ABC transporter permease [Vallicoccus soli]